MKNKRYWDDEEDYVGRRMPQKDVYDKYRHKVYEYDEDEEVFDDDYVGDEYFEE
jgi:hypothetical protein